MQNENPAGVHNHQINWVEGPNRREFLKASALCSFLALCGLPTEIDFWRDIRATGIKCYLFSKGKARITRDRELVAKAGNGISNYGALNIEAVHFSAKKNTEYHGIRYYKPNVEEVAVHIRDIHVGRGEIPGEDQYMDLWFGEPIVPKKPGRFIVYLDHNLNLRVSKHF